jgi:hypothetical protein
MNDICYTKDEVDKLHAYYKIGFMHKNNNELDEMVGNYENVIRLYDDLYDKDFDLLDILDECLRECIKFNMVNDKEKAMIQINKLVELYNHSQICNREIYDTEEEYLSVTYRQLNNFYEYACFMLTVNKEEGMNFLNEIIEKLYVYKGRTEFDKLLDLCTSKLSIENKNLENYPLGLDYSLIRIKELLELYSTQNFHNPKLFIAIIGAFAEKLKDMAFYKSNINYMIQVVNYLFEVDKQAAVGLINIYLQNIENLKIYRKMNIVQQYEFFISHIIANNIPVADITKLLKRYVQLICKSNTSNITISQEIIILYFKAVGKYEINDIRKYISIDSYRNKTLFSNVMRLRIRMKTSPKYCTNQALQLYNLIFEINNNTLSIKIDMTNKVDNIIPVYIFLEQYIQVTQDKLDTLKRRLFKYNCSNLFFSKRYKANMLKFIDSIGGGVGLCQQMGAIIPLNNPSQKYGNEVIEALNYLTITYAIFTKRMGIKDTPKDDVLKFVNEWKLQSTDLKFDLLIEEINKYFK